MALIQGIDGGALLQAFRQGRSDRAADDKAKTAKAQEAQWNGLMAQALGGAQPSGGVAGNYAPSQPQTPPVAPGATFGEAFSPQAMTAIQNGPPAPPAPPTAPPQGPRQVDPSIIQRMAILRPEQAGQIASTLKTLDETRLKARAAVNDASGAAAHYIQQGATPQERQQRFQNAAAHLRENGVPEEGIQRLGSDLSDTALQGYQAMAMDFDKIVDNELAERQFQEGKVITPQPGAGAFVVHPGGAVDTIVAPNDGSHPVGSPVGGAPVRVQSVEQAHQLPPGTRFIDPNGVERVVPGGGVGNGASNFPSGNPLDAQ